MTDWAKVAEEIKQSGIDLAEALQNVDHNARVAGYLLGKANGMREAVHIAGEYTVKVPGHGSASFSGPSAKMQEILLLADKIERGEA